MPLQSRHTRELSGPSLSLSTDPIRLRAKSFVSPSPSLGFTSVWEEGEGNFLKDKKEAERRKEEIEPGSVEQKKVRVRKRVK